MPLPEQLHRFWIALDDLVADVLPTTWGAVVTDARFPDVWDTNYARVDVPSSVSLARIEEDLLPALQRAGIRVEHVVSFHHEGHGDLLAELSSRGHRISWDLAMVLDGPPAAAVCAGRRPALITARSLLLSAACERIDYARADDGEFAACGGC